MFDFTRQLTLGSALLYAKWRAGGRSGPVTLALKSGPRFELRPDSCGNNDYGVSYEIFVLDYYDDRGRIAANDVKLIADLGANVGFSLLYFLHQYPHCRILAFEPHPSHYAQARRNLAVDGTAERVELYQVAAGASARAMRLTDRRSSSTLAEEAGASDTLAVDVADIFPLLEDKRLDILKVDIEGGEYEILSDPRFEHLDVGTIVMEWHSRGGGIEDKEWCEQRLCGLGFTIEEIFTQASHGMFWGWR